MKVTNEMNLPQPFVDAASYQRVIEPKRYSVTQLLKGTREIMLTRRHDEEITVDASDSVWAIFGTAVHEVLKRSRETAEQLQEQYVTMEMPNGYTLSGIFDLYDDSTGTVTDWKTASVWKAIKGDWVDYRQQVTCYVLMLRSMGFDAHRGQVVALLKDWSASKTHEHGYPQHPVVTVEWEFTLDELEDTRLWILDKFAEIERCEDLPDDELPMCTDEQRWTRPGKFAVMRKGRKSAVKLWDTYEEAQEHADKLGKGHHVEERPAEHVKCDRYCAAAPFCRRES